MTVGRRSSASGAETRAKIMEATIQTLRHKGIVGTSARSIAQTGGFNAALIFYHFGTISDLLVAAVEHKSQQAIARYAQRLANVERLTDLADLAAELHREDVAAGNVTVLAQVLAASSSDPELGQRLLKVFEPWIALVQEVLDRVVASTPFEKLFPTTEAAFAITCLFLGLELLTHLGQDFARGEALFETFQANAGLAERLVTLLGPRAGP